MTGTDRQLLKDLAHVKITYDQFLKHFSVDVKKDSEFVGKEMKTAIETNDPNEIGMTLPLIWLSGDIPKYIDILNELLINPHHKKPGNCKVFTRLSKSCNCSICKKSVRE